MQAADILEFWFEELESAQWFKKDIELDRLIAERFADIHRQARQCELYRWRTTPAGRLAEILILDQFSRNMFRDTPAAFFCDYLALALAQEAVHSGADQALQPLQRTFLYMPYMHSESPVIHDEAVKLFTDNGVQNNLDYELKHKAIIDRFGRYPHRNELLGRQSTPEELEFLQQPDSSF